MLLLAIAAVPVVAQTPGDERRRLFEARRAAAVAAAHADRLARAAGREQDAADRARADEAVLVARVAAAAAALDAARARVALVDTLLAAQARRLAIAQGPAARLTGALASLARRPALAALAGPGTLADQVHVRAVLAATLPAVRARTAALRVELERARRLRAAAALAAQGLRDGRARLEGERTALATLEASHRSRAGALGRSALGESDRALAFGERARDLIEAMDEAGRTGAAAVDLAALPGPMPRPLAPDAVLPAPPAGAYRLPVAGRLLVGFGEVSAAGVRSRGLSFAVAPGAVVVAPAGGVVRYAGRFRSYRDIVVIDHGGGWSSLLTGLGTIGVAVGAGVAAGAPIGRAASGDDPRVTVELRRRGVPVDAAALVG